ncbi:hypothetical protein DFH06DRAFT_1350062 [Mycena polygramma]|nr:hypothetical protein DFH06DRAFT_1350062 [Mycena polygramma]
MSTPAVPNALPPLRVPGDNSRELNRLISRAEGQGLEGPWYSVFHLAAESKLCSINDNAFEFIAIQEGMQHEPEEGSRQKRVPDFFVVLQPYEDGKEGIPMTVVENKKKADVDSLQFREIYLDVWLQVSKQVRLAFLSSGQHVQVVGAIVTIGKYWSYREYDRDSKDMFQDTDCSDWDYELTDMDLDTDDIVDLDTHDMNDTQENVVGNDTQVTAGLNMVGGSSLEAGDDVRTADVDIDAMDTESEAQFTDDSNDSLKVQVGAAESLELDFNNPRFTFETGVDNTFVFTLGEETSNRALERIRERNLGRYPSVWTPSLPVPYTTDEADWWYACAASCSIDPFISSSSSLYPGPSRIRPPHGLGRLASRRQVSPLGGSLHPTVLEASPTRLSSPRPGCPLSTATCLVRIISHHWSGLWNLSNAHFHPKPGEAPIPFTDDTPAQVKTVTPPPVRFVSSHSRFALAQLALDAAVSTAGYDSYHLALAQPHVRDASRPSPCCPANPELLEVLRECATAWLGDAPRSVKSAP